MSWDFAIPNPLMPIFTVVTGLRFEAVIKNENAGLTGLEIIAVIGAIAFLAAVIAGIALASWAVYEIMTAAIELGPVATVGIGLIVVVLIGVGLLLLFGVKFKGKAGKVAVKAGK